jgi:hypothetical protein
VRKLILVAALLGLMAIATTTAVAQNGPLSVPQVGTKDNGFSKTDERYLDLYVEAGKKFGWTAVGRNIVDDGLNRPGNPQPSDSQIEASINRLDLMIHPPPPPAPEPAPAPVDTSTATTTTATTSTTSGGCPSYMAAEASSPSAVNPSSGAAGCYQVTPGTQAAYPECSDVNSSSCVAAICADAGNAAWSASGATPCDYIKP